MAKKLNQETIDLSQKALEDFKSNGFIIEQISEDKFKVFDNGKFGFAEDEGAFIVDAENLIEMAEMYLD